MVSPAEPVLIIVSGPTAVGKTHVAIQIAREFNTDIVSADSRQFYREMQVGTAPPSPEQLAEVRHHFIGHLSLHQAYDVATYEKDALQLLEKLFRKKNTVVMTGGSGLYLKAVYSGLDELPDTNPAVRERLRNMHRSDGIGALQEMLKEKDPEYYRTVDLNNPARLLRALEVCETTGRPFSSFLRKSPAKRRFRVIKIALNLPRAELHQRINARVDEMVRNGLVEEAQGLHAYRHLNALRTVGYTELFRYFDGKVTRETAIGNIKTNTRRYAKRQITWLKKEGFHWLPPDEKAVIAFLRGEPEN